MKKISPQKPFSFEEIYKEYHEVDIQLNASDISQQNVLDSKNRNYTLFKAFQRGKIYSTIQRKNSREANDYFEEGVVHCDDVLKDLIKIFHPSLLPDHELLFYKKLN